MKKFITKPSKKAGLPPGSLVHIGEQKAEKAVISIIDYDETTYEEKKTQNVEDCFKYKDTPTVTWINIDGVHCAETMEKLGEFYNLHPLLLEDIMNTEQRPKIDELEGYLFIILKMLYFEKDTEELKAEQVSLILGSKMLFSFQEVEGDIFDPIRERLKDQKRKLRKQTADYLLYTLIDVIVDNYFSILEKIEDRIEDLEEELLNNPTTATLESIHDLKREMLFLRKSIWPLREVIINMTKGELALIHESTNIYLRDVYDHTIHVIDTIESFRDIIAGMLDIYLSSLSNAMNSVMKVLTIIATIFIPLTLIVGIYGMNFKNMPELEWSWGYYGVWFVMIIIAGFMLSYFKRKNWI